ncbi:MAG: Lcl C-terminal domain-containing protein [Candidatus Heimdallarchaeota archaeon]
MKKILPQKYIILLLIIPLLIINPLFASSYSEESQTLTVNDASTDYTIVDTGLTICYDNTVEIAYPLANESFFGQDATYMGNHPHYQNNDDGTITDLITNLMWQQDPGDKKTFTEAVSGAESFVLAGYDDWRLPTIKELYSLISFKGIDPSGPEDAADLIPFIDSNYFVFEYGDESAGERIIDSQYWSSTEYVSTTMGGDATVFGVNFADGRIKGYPRDLGPMGSPHTEFTLYVRGNTLYGVNDFIDNGNGTVSDLATDLMWSKNDSNEGMNWEEAFDWVQQKNTENYLGYNDWRLPNAKELQSIVDYTRSPNTTDSAAIDPIFNISTIIDEGGSENYPFFWTGTTHRHFLGGSNAAYVCFGEALGWMQDPMTLEYTLDDVHGAGAQRSDPKTGNPDDYPYGHGPQGDVIRIDNYVRLVRGGVAEIVESEEDYPIYFTPSVNFSTIFAIVGLIGLSTLLLIIRKRK